MRYFNMENIPVHRYFFWIEDFELEVYKDGVLVPYHSEQKVSYKDGIDHFFELWKQNSAYIEEDFVDFTFIGTNKDKIEQFMKYSEQFPNDCKEKFTFEDLKKILDRKEISKFCIEIESKKYYLSKTKFHYSNTSKDENLEKIYVCGSNISDVFLENGTINMDVHQNQRKEGKIASFFRNKLKNSSMT